MAHQLIGHITLQTVSMVFTLEGKTINVEMNDAWPGHMSITVGKDTFFAHNSVRMISEILKMPYGKAECAVLAGILKQKGII